MENYEKKETIKPDRPTPAQNEIIVTKNGKLRGYISYGDRLYKEAKKAEEMPSTPVYVVKAEGKSVTRAVTVIEIFKRMHEDMYPEISVNYVCFRDIWEPKDDDKGAENLVITRNVPSICAKFVHNPEKAKAEAQKHSNQPQSSHSGKRSKTRKKTETSAA
eukprot:Clim_evm24s149 gene=Clim_evmTU24s149